VAAVFDDEQQCLNRIFHTEIKNLLVGIGVTATVLASLRMGSKYALSTIFGEAKSKAFKEAEVEAKKRGTEGFQNRMGRNNLHHCVIRCLLDRFMWKFSLLFLFI
jgi:hypothetical protein